MEAMAEKGLVSAVAERVATLPPQQYYQVCEYLYEMRWSDTCKTYTQDGKLGNGRVLLLHGLDVVRNLASNLWRRVCAKEVVQLLLLVVVVRRIAIIESDTST
jgi:hypothetical protein